MIHFDESSMMRQATRVGSMNAYQQRVLAYAHRRHDQTPLVVLRCGVCGHHTVSKSMVC